MYDLTKMHVIIQRTHVIYILSYTCYMYAIYVLNRSLHIVYTINVLYVMLYMMLDIMLQICFIYMIYYKCYIHMRYIILYAHVLYIYINAINTRCIYVVHTNYPLLIHIMHTVIHICYVYILYTGYSLKLGTTYLVSMLQH